MPDNAISPTLEEAADSTTLASRTFDSIKADIISGNLAQGAKIVESDLALQYGISRGPLREAIHRLEQMKLIVRVPHAGSRVVTLDVKLMEDIYTAREALEGMAARLAARHMSAAEIDALSALLDQHEAAIGKTAGKAYFQTGQVPSRAPAALAQHRQIAAAIAARDEELAEMLMRRHISGAWAVVKQILEEQ